MIKSFPYVAGLAIALTLSVGGVVHLSGDKEQTEILPIAKNEVQVPGSRRFDFTRWA